MKNFVWIAAVLLLLSFVYPNGPAVNVRPPVKPDVVPPVVVPTDPKIVELLIKADAEDKRRIADVYTALRTVMKRDITKPPARITTTEQWAEVQANTLQLAIEQPGKYPGLDEAIEAVFVATLGTDDVLPGNEDTRNKILSACEIISNSASK